MPINLKLQVIYLSKIPTNCNCQGKMCTNQPILILSELSENVFKLANGLDKMDKSVILGLKYIWKLILRSFN